MKLLLTKPPDKNWGLVVIANQDLADRLKSCMNYINQQGDFFEPIWASLLRGCRPFIQCDTENYLFIEFWTESNDLILRCMEVLSNYLGVEWDLQ